VRNKGGDDRDNKAASEKADGEQMIEIQGQMENLVAPLGSRWHRQTDREAGRQVGSKHSGISVDASINTPLKA